MYVCICFNCKFVKIHRKCSSSNSNEGSLFKTFIQVQLESYMYMYMYATAVPAFVCGEHRAREASIFLLFDTFKIKQTSVFLKMCLIRSRLLQIIHV